MFDNFLLFPIINNSFLNDLFIYANIFQHYTEKDVCDNLCIPWSIIKYKVYKVFWLNQIIYFVWVWNVKIKKILIQFLQLTITWLYFPQLFAGSILCTLEDITYNNLIIKAIKHTKCVLWTLDRILFTFSATNTCVYTQDLSNVRVHTQGKEWLFSDDTFPFSYGFHLFLPSIAALFYLLFNQSRKKF
jgi:hypothetical protein